MTRTRRMRPFLSVLVAAAVVPFLAHRAAALTKTVQVGSGNSLTFRDTASGTATTTINVGDIVQWDWSNGFHSTTGVTAPETWDSGPHAAPFSYTHQFLLPGTY